jgi:hypothetical protein
MPHSFVSDLPEIDCRPADAPDSQEGLADDRPIEVSVCIANWNCRELLRACLTSLHRQPQGVGLETIVVDNASQDGAADMVAREFPEVVLCRNATNRGFARANNQAASMARGRYLFFLNNDTVIPPGALGRMVAYLQAHPEVGLLGPRLRDPQGRAQVSYRKRPTLAALLHRTYLLRWTGLLRRAHRQYRRQHFDPDKTRQVEVLMGAAMLMRREVFQGCGGWDEDFTFGGEDVDLSVRVGRQHRLVFLPSVEITHHGRVSSRLNVGYSSTHIAAGLARYLRKTGTPAPLVTFYKLVVTLDAPVLIAAKGMEYVWRRYWGQTSRANKSWLSLRGGWHFLTRGLRAFWQA